MQAVVGAAAVEYLNSVDAVARGLAAQFKVPVGEVAARVAGAHIAVRCWHAHHSAASSCCVRMGLLALLG